MTNAGSTSKNIQDYRGISLALNTKACMIMEPRKMPVRGNPYVEVSLVVIKVAL